ncbi:hypothetical protein AB1286_23410 [Trinickia sp. NRRL B-1857]|uniref:hypothetical protein n=1 Tax=Trinickia sp. NRRL B-1857 TaxID=3162879 RepID=UPI003D2E4C27
MGDFHFAHESHIETGARMIEASTIPQNVYVFIDGTWNSDKEKAKTNVRKLFDATRVGLIEGREHRKLYIPGVGRKPTAEASSLKEADYDRELARLLNQEFSIGMAPFSRNILGGALKLTRENGHLFFLKRRCRYGQASEGVPGGVPGADGGVGEGGTYA